MAKKLSQRLKYDLMEGSFMVIGIKIKKIRLNNKLTQEEFGNMIGVSKTAVCNYELGKKYPCLKNIVKISREFNIDSNYLLGTDVSIVAEDKQNYLIKLSSEDIKIIRELKKHPKVYKKLLENPQRTIKAIEKNWIN